MQGKSTFEHLDIVHIRLLVVTQAELEYRKPEAVKCASQSCSESPSLASALHVCPTLPTTPLVSARSSDIGVPRQATCPEPFS